MVCLEGEKRKEKVYNPLWLSGYVIVGLVNAYGVVFPVGKWNSVDDVDLLPTLSLPSSSPPPVENY